MKSTAVDETNDSKIIFSIYIKTNSETWRKEKNWWRTKGIYVPDSTSSEV